jgi:hypothetical protein
MSEVLQSLDLLTLILAEDVSEERHRCCVLSMHSGGTTVRRISLARFLRLRLVARAWEQACAACIDDAKSFDLSGVWVEHILSEAIYLLPCFNALTNAREIVLDGCAWTQVSPSLAACRSLTALSLRVLSVPDASIAALLHSVLGAGNLRTLSLGGCRSVGAMCIAALRERDVGGRTAARSLTALDLSGCPKVVAVAARSGSSAATRLGPITLDACLRACNHLARLDLSDQPHLGSAVIGSVLLILAGSLTHLSLRGCGLTDDDMCLESPSASEVSSSSSETSLPPAPSPLWQRMTGLRELALADNPRLSVRAHSILLSSVPTLRALDLGGSDFWVSEVTPLLHAVASAPSLSALGCEGCGAWLDEHVLRRLSRLGLSVVASTELWERLARCGAGDAPPARVSPAQGLAPPLDSWEELAEAVDVPLALKLADGTAGQGAIDTVSQRSRTTHTTGASTSTGTGTGTGTRLAPIRLIDYSRPSRYREPPRSIYHVSQGRQPYYGDGRAVRSQTDTHGLRT